MSSDDTPLVVGARAVMFAGLCGAVGYAIATKPASAPFAVGAPMFAAGLFLHLAARRLTGVPLLVASAMGLAVAALGALALAEQDALWTGGGLALVAVAGLLRVPALLGRRAPAAVAWIPGREVPILLLGAAAGAWAVGRPRAGADAVLVDWMAGIAAALALAVLFVPRPRPEWATSPGRRHEQRVTLRPDPRATAWRQRTARFVDRGQDADGYFAEWRRVLERTGLDDAEADRILAEARSATTTSTIWRRNDRERRAKAHATLVRRLTNKDPDTREGA